MLYYSTEENLFWMQHAYIIHMKKHHRGAHFNFKCHLINLQLVLSVQFTIRESFTG